jgi:O-succinylbenzoic acid--CoA ligase
MEALDAALVGSGPALAFGPTQFSRVPQSIAVVIPTSGSTGTPKEVALSASALKASAKAAHEFLGAHRGERWSLQLPTNHIAGVNVLVRALELGSDISTTDFEFTSIVPTQLFRALQSRDDELLGLQNAKAVLVGGAATSSELLNQAREKGINVVTTYGMSEMSGGCVYNNWPLPGVEVEIRADQRIALRGAMQAASYLGLETPLADSNGWFLTSDAGEIRDGKLFVLGRVDDQIISGGEKISLSVIDEFLNTQNLGEFMSCSIENVEWGQQLCLAGTKDFDKSKVSELLRDQFGKHAVPKIFLKSVELPRTSLGKADRGTLSKSFEMIRQ